MRVAIAAAVLLAASSAGAYRLTQAGGGVGVHWGDFPVAFTFDPRRANGRRGDPRGVDAGSSMPGRRWTAAAVRWWTPAAPTLPDAQAGDDTNLLIFLGRSVVPGADSALAITTPVYTVADGVLIDADTVFNGLLFEWAVDGAPIASTSSRWPPMSWATASASITPARWAASTAPRTAACT
ncbi:MAG: hypothetical protein R3F43_12015 [bacterium]